MAGTISARRLVFTERARVETERFELPSEPPPGAVVVENAYGVISPGTELAMFTATHIGFPLPEFRYAKYPFQPGYAAVGHVLAVGDGVEGLREGDAVLTGSTHASHAVVPARHAFSRIPEGLPLERVPFASMAHVSLTAVRLSDIRLGSDVAVFGLGLVGNLAAQLLRCAGARVVIGVDPVGRRRDAALECGIDVALDPAAGDVVAAVRERCRGRGCGIAVEATGDPGVVKTALACAAQRGQVLLLGSPRGKAEIDLYFDVHVPGVQIIGAHTGRQSSGARFGDPDPDELLLELMQTGRLNIASLHTHTLPASQARTAYEGLLERKDEYLGVILDLSRW